MSDLKKLDKRDSIRVVTSNDLIMAEDIIKLSLNARKLFYVAASQCKMSDQEFYEFETTPQELADMWAVDSSNIYREADKVTDELMKIVIKLRTEEVDRKRHIFETCDYLKKEGRIIFKLHKDMTNLLLGLNEENPFSKPEMWDFMKMRSPYSMAIWHLMQREMRSFKPMMSKPIEFDLTLEELRQVTGCEKKLKQIGQFKTRVLDKAIREIRDNCLCSITYDNIKKSRTVIGFRFTATSMWGNRDPEKLTLRQRQHMRMAELIGKKQAGSLTDDELEEYKGLYEALMQTTIEDFDKGEKV